MCQSFSNILANPPWSLKFQCIYKYNLTFSFLWKFCNFFLLSGPCCPQWPLSQANLLLCFSQGNLKMLVQNKQKFLCSTFIPKVKCYPTEQLCLNLPQVSQSKSFKTLDYEYLSGTKLKHFIWRFGCFSTKLVII